jgi:hypothetical protein
MDPGQGKNDGITIARVSSRVLKVKKRLAGFSQPFQRRALWQLRNRVPQFP